MSALSAFVLVPFLFSSVSAHIAFFGPSMYGFNVTGQTYPYDNRPVTPLMNLPFDKWWFHGHLDHPPHKDDFFELPAGKSATAELACNKGATSWYASSDGGDIRQGDWPCPGQPSSQFHTTGKADTKGCALAIAYKADVNSVKPEDFVVFSVNHTCVWNRFTTFEVPADMPACPEGGCHCAWFWIHSYDSGSEQNYMNGFQCKVTGARPNAPAVAKSQVARRCGADPDHGVPQATPSNCTQGAKAPFYWFQAEGNNMFEGTYAPPYYNDLYNFKDGAQTDIFVTSPSGPVSSASPSSSSTPALHTPTAVPHSGSGTPHSPSVNKNTTTTGKSRTPPSSCDNHPASKHKKHAISTHARRSRARNFGHN